MAPKKGVSFDDKRLRLLEIFSRAEVFTLKEIEKIGSKEKGIVEQTIKDVLQTLVDDGLVETDKIGAGNFYWALPSKAGNSRRSQISKLQGEIQLKAAATSELEKRKRESESLRGDSGRAAKIAEHAALASNIKRLREEFPCSVHATQRFLLSFRRMRKWLRLQRIAGPTICSFCR